MIQKYWEQLTQLWTRLNQRQRLIIGGGTLATVIALGFLIKAMGSNEYKPLMTGLEPDDAQLISQQLAAKKIDYKLSADGHGIDVGADQLDQARMEVASQGATHSGRMGFELFDKTSWGQTEFDEKVNYQRALEGELERTISTMNGVKSARVHLVLPRDSVFMDRERPAKASVTLRLKRGSLTQNQLEAIARLVSGAVDNLSPNDIAIIDADNNQPLNEHGGDQGDRELEDVLSKRLIATLGPVVGVDNLRASVNVEYDRSSSEESQDKYDPTVSAVLTTQKSMEQVRSGASDGGVAGTTSNLPSKTARAAAQDASTDTGTQTSSSENSTFGVNRIARHTISPAGGVRRITAAILVNDAADKKMVNGKLTQTTYKRSATELRQLQALASAVLGADLQRGDVITVEDMAFVGPGDQDTAPTLSEKLQRSFTDYATPLRYASLAALLAFAWLFILRPVQKELVASLRAMETKEQMALTDVTSASTPELPADTLDTMLEPDINTVGLKRKLSDMVQAEPVAMTRTVQSWLQEN